MWGIKTCFLWCEQWWPSLCGLSLWLYITVKKDISNPWIKFFHILIHTCLYPYPYCMGMDTYRFLHMDMLPEGKGTDLHIKYRDYHGCRSSGWTPTDNVSVQIYMDMDMRSWISTNIWIIRVVSWRESDLLLKIYSILHCISLYRWLYSILYHFIQFVSHMSQPLKNRRNVTIVTVILVKWLNYLLTVLVI